MPAAMHAIVFEEQELARTKDETVLDCLLKHNIDIASGCRSGVCQSCVLELDTSDHCTPALTGLYQQGLSVEQQQAGQILACCSKPEATVRLRRVNSSALRVPATVIEKFWLNDSVICLRLHTQMQYRPGQYLTLWRDASIARSYSIASCPANENYLELHIRHYEQGACSGWIASDLRVGDSLELQGPMGSFFYAAEINQPLLLCAMGTGLSAIYGVLKDALASGHTGTIGLVVAAKNSSGLYLLDELRALEARHDNLSVDFLVQAPDDSCEIAQQGDVYDHCTTQVEDLSQRKIYLCGGESFVAKLRKRLFMAGIALNNIRADSFLSFV
ncbi:MAG: 2Fe-2S iron-sulfur cluster binding domain-containing protein [Pseudomonadales bacterium]|nr:2Fe-2S iron-sulfur cluster binding domain-containing protein [Pseudomonadales bacterium]